MKSGRPPFGKKPGSLSGWGVLELLICVGIVIVIASLLFPLLSSAAQRAKGVKCAANLRSIGVAIHQYIADHNGFFPPARERSVADSAGNRTLSPFLCWTLSAYIPNPEATLARPGATCSMAGVWWCPGDNDPEMRPVPWAKVSYSFNYKMGGDSSVPTTWSGAANPNYDAKYAKLIAVGNASRLIYAIDHVYPSVISRQNYFTGTSWPLKSGSPPVLPPNTLALVDFKRHGPANALFVDGSVRPMGYDDLVGTGDLYVMPQGH